MTRGARGHPGDRDIRPGRKCAEVDARRALLRDCTAASIADAGHMLHHDQPQAVAATIEAFLQARGHAHVDERAP